MKKLHFLSVLVLFFSVCDSYRILLVFPFPSVSHSILGEGYVRRLLEGGHEVTYITAIPIKEKLARLHQVDLSSMMTALPPSVFTIDNCLEKRVDFGDYSIIFDMMHHITEKVLLHENIQSLIHDPKVQFDAVVAEWMYSELYAGFSAVFNCPLIWSSSVDPHWLAMRLIDELPNPAYNPDIFSSRIPPFSYVERVQELWKQMKTSAARHINMAKPDEELYIKAFKAAVEKRGRTLPPFEVIKYNASLMLGNSHVSSGEASRLPQSYKPIGGYHIEDEVKALPDNLQRIADNATNGLIYFSMGSLLQSKDMPEKMKVELMEMFRGLKQTVLWKFEEDLEYKPDNVHLIKWAPQRSILAHPNTKLFITHGGLLSTTEALHYGVPIIGIPGFADQHLNVNRAVKKGFAKGITLSHGLAGDLKEAIEEIISNPRYTERVKELSLIYHDRPVKPGVELSHWVSHVVKSKGALHLRSPALLVPWYQKMYLDLLGFVLIGIYVVFCIGKFVLKYFSLSGKKDKLL